MQPPDQSGQTPAPGDAPKPDGATTEAPSAKRRRNFWENFLLRLALYGTPIVILAAIAIPNFVKAKTTRCKNACVANLKQIDGAVQQWALENKKLSGDAAVLSEVVTYLKGSTLPVCPAGGVYSVGRVSDNPKCSITNDGGQVHRLE